MERRCAFLNTAAETKKPIIGVAPSYDYEMRHVMTRQNYLTSIMGEGGVPLILPLTEDESTLFRAAELCDGFLFPGGVDLHPSLFGEDTLQACGEICPIRDSMELKLMEYVLENDKPALGICRGIQTMNVALGGTLYQDIPAQTAGRLCHSQKPPYDFGVHRILIEKDSLLYTILGKESIMVNSMHHQAVKDTAASLSTAAVAPDGIVECVWRPQSRFFLGVQWHPEYLYAVSEDHRKLFGALVEASRDGM